MSQGKLVRLNEDKWKAFELKLKDIDKVPADELAYMYVHLTEDLAYSRGKFPNSNLTIYLNELTLKVHNAIFRNKPEEKSRFIKFWSQEVPRELKSSYSYIAYSFLIFTVGILIGVLSAANDETFIRLILSDAYVDKTLQNISSGDPMAIYKDASEGNMFFLITINNIRVALMAFAMGILFSIGTGYILFQNGMMLGVFHYLFFQNNVFDETILTIWIHGTLEISAIIIAGAAGLIMGNGFLFPGTYTRMHSFQIAAKKGLKIVISLVPFFIAAGFLESFITRQTHWPLHVKIFIIMISLFITILYLFILPNLNTYERAKN
ncbi:MAG: stage II sporulation protein M [Bacteroidota bacterium]|nr:stage II sporulation protein M [Bacteroidota bacterium]